MKINKKVIINNAIGNLYRSALFFARNKGEEKIALELTKKATKELSSYPSFSPSVKRIKATLKKYSHQSAKDRLLLAEKVLDEYLLLK